MDLTYPLVPVVNFLACILVLASLSKSMFKSWNVGACSFAIWVVIVAFTVAVDSIIWADNVDNSAPVWCDIVIRLQIGSLAAIPASSLVIVRRLSLMMRQCDACSTKKQKRNLLLDLFLCIGLPAINMALYYIVQTGRFEILEEYGCTGEAANAGLTILFLDSVPIVLSLMSLTLYSPRLIWTYFKQKELDELLASGSPLDRRSFHKILALGLFDILITIPEAVFNLVVTTLQGKIQIFWPGWGPTHAEISSIATATSEEWKSIGFGVVFGVRFSQWSNPAFAVMFFALFGLTENNRMWYRNLFWTVMKPFGFTPRMDPVVSQIVFDSRTVHGFGSSGLLPTTIENQSAIIDTVGRRPHFEIAAEIGKAKCNSLETQTSVSLPSPSETRAMDP